MNRGQVLLLALLRTAKISPAFLLGAVLTQLKSPFTYAHLLHQRGSRNGGAFGY